MYELTLFISAVLIGLMGSGHCLGMCGGIAGAHSFSTPSRSGQRSTSYGQLKNASQNITVGSGHLIAGTGTSDPENLSQARPTATSTSLLSTLVVFNIGRLTSYALIGFLAGGLGAALALNMTALIVLRSLAAMMLVLMGLHVGNWWSGLVKVEKLGSGIWRFLSPKAEKLRQEKGIVAEFGLGMIWGWLPCGLVYSALTWSMTSADPRIAALLMFGFGLGTLPSMIAAGLMAYHLRRWLSRISVRRTFAIGLILFGLWSIPISWSNILSTHSESAMHHHSSILKNPYSEAVSSGRHLLSCALNSFKITGLDTYQSGLLLL